MLKVASISRGRVKQEAEESRRQKEATIGMLYLG